jgi:hypothetical protein
MFGEDFIASLARPTSNFAVGYQRQSPQVVLPPGVPQVGKQVLKAKLQTEL